jgi:hypothetical protein
MNNKWKVEDIINTSQASEILGINIANTKIWIQKNLKENIDFKKFPQNYVINKAALLKALEKTKSK